ARGVVSQGRVGSVWVRELMCAVGGFVSPTTSAFEAAEGMIRDRCLAYPVVDNGRVVGVVTAALVERVPPANRQGTPVAEVMRPDQALAAAAPLTPPHHPLLCLDPLA